MDWRPPDPSNTEADDSSDANIAPVYDRNATTTPAKQRDATTAPDDASDAIIGHDDNGEATTAPDNDFKSCHHSITTDSTL